MLSFAVLYFFNVFRMSLNCYSKEWLTRLSYNELVIQFQICYVCISFYTICDSAVLICRTRMHKSRTQKSTVVKDGQAKQTHLERLEDTPDSLRPDDLQQHLHQLLRRYCTPEVTEEPDAGQDSDAGVQDKQ